jgi:anti-repressor protein
MTQEGLIEFVDTPQADDNIQVFSHAKFGQIRIAGTADAPEFCAMDLCKALGYTNGRDAVAKHVDNPDVAKRDAWVVTGKKADGSDAKRLTSLTFVNESGMYALIFGSTLPQAKQFKHWVTSEVLPSIRKTGSYSVEQLSRKQLALMVVQAEEEKERLALENKQQAELLEEQKPKVVFADAVIGSGNNILVRDLAKLICQNGYQIGEIRLYKWLREHKYLTLENKPMQRYVEQGLFYLEEGTHTEKGVMKSHTVTKVTGKGQSYFINKFMSE